MRPFTFASVFSLAYLPSLQAAALSLPSTSLTQRSTWIEGKEATHFQAIIELDDGIPTDPPQWVNGTDSGLQRRQGIRYCISGTAQAGVCLAVGGLVTQIGTGIGTAVKSKSDKHDCTAQDGQIDDVTYRVYATGRNCDTTAQLGTISGAIDKYLRDVNKNVCGTHCIQLTHGGTWTGYVVLAPSGTDVDSFYCGSAYTFGSCGTGGVNDQHE
jgi:hypothetical protein